MSLRSKRDLEIVLSKLKTFTDPSAKLEQYQTPSSIAASWVWEMAMRSEVAGKTILDAACGTGILGLGLLLLGARKVYFLDIDSKVLNICIENYNTLKQEYELGTAEFLPQDINLFDGAVDLVIQNPPFGTKDEHADKRFLEKAFNLAPLVYSMHKYSTKKFLEVIAKDHNFAITHIYQHEFPIKRAFSFHTKPVEKIEVAIWRLEKRTENFEK